VLKNKLCIHVANSLLIFVASLKFSIVETTNKPTCRAFCQYMINFLLSVCSGNKGTERKQNIYMHKENSILKRVFTFFNRLMRVFGINRPVCVKICLSPLPLTFIYKSLYCVYNNTVKPLGRLLIIARVLDRKMKTGLIEVLPDPWQSPLQAIIVEVRRKQTIWKKALKEKNFFCLRYAGLISRNA
jgi:hypothetical protein